MIRLLLAFALALCIGCAASSYDGGAHVGPCKVHYSTPEITEYNKWMGHNARDIDNPSRQDVIQYCKICHYVW